MSSLDDLAKNAIPPKTDKEPTVYVPPGTTLTKSKPKVVNPTDTAMSTTEKIKNGAKIVEDASTLGGPSKDPEQLPNIYEHWMNNLDAAFQRDKERMWTTIQSVQEEIDSKKTFGEGGDEAYFNGEISTDMTPTVGKSNTENTIEISKDASAKIRGTDKDKEINTESEDSFLDDDSIYEGEGEETNMANVPNIEDDATFLPGFEEYGDPNYKPEAKPVSYRATENGIESVSADKVQAARMERALTEETYTPEIISEVPKEEPVITESVFSADQASAGAADMVPTGPIRFSDSVIEEAFGDSDDEDIQDETTDDDEPTEDMLAMQAFVRSNIKPINNTIDLKDYKISKKYATASRALNTVNKHPVHTAKWILPATGQSIIMSALLGTEIDVLANRRQGQTDLMRNEEIIKLFYNHVVSPKPGNWKDWAKTILYDDLSHLYFAVYLAGFAKSNFAPFECAKDKHQFMQPVDIMSMVKYKDKAAEEYCKKLLDKDPNSTTVKSIAKQISDDVVIAFRKPSLYNVLIEDMYLPDKVRNELSDIVAIFRHVEDMYIINRETRMLDPIDTKPDATNITKTLKNRFKIYYDILKSLSSDQLNSITPIMSKLHDQIETARYQYPEVVCPKCGSIIKSELQQPIDILFTRHRLQIILA